MLGETGPGQEAPGNRVKTLALAAGSKRAAAQGHRPVGPMAGKVAEERGLPKGTAAQDASVSERWRVSPGLAGGQEKSNLSLFPQGPSVLAPPG